MLSLCIPMQIFNIVCSFLRKFSTFTLDKDEDGNIHFSASDLTNLGHDCLFILNQNEFFNEIQTLF